MPRPPRPARLIGGDGSDLPLFSGTPHPARPSAPHGHHAPTTPPPHELPGMPERPSDHVSVNGFMVRREQVPALKVGGRGPHVVHHTSAWQPGEEHRAWPSQADAAWGGLMTLCWITPAEATALEQATGVWLTRRALAHETTRDAWPL